jgi:hypothetical protein
MTRNRYWSTATAIILLVVTLVPWSNAAEKDIPDPLKTITAFAMAGHLHPIPGFLPLYWSPDEGRLYLEVPALDQDMIYLTALASGVGANEIGADRGQIGFGGDAGEGRIVRFRRLGRRVFLVQPNLDFRSSSSNPDERKAIHESFVESILAGFEAKAEEGGRVLVDITSFVLTDSQGILGQLKDGKAKATFALDKDRSAVVYPDGLHGFPRNTDIEVMLTFNAADAKAAGAVISKIAPTPTAITIRQKHSFLALPEDGYVPRAFDPRAGYFGLQYTDFAAPLGESISKR